MNREHGKNYDSKNMSHMYRLLNVALEIAELGILNVRRSPKEVEKLLKIRKGIYDYDDLIDDANKMISKLDKAFNKSHLPDQVDSKYANKLLLDIRKKRYKIDADK